MAYAENLPMSKESIEDAIRQFQRTLKRDGDAAPTSREDTDVVWNTEPEGPLQRTIRKPYGRNGNGPHRSASGDVFDPAIGHPVPQTNGQDHGLYRRDGVAQHVRTGPKSSTSGDIEKGFSIVGGIAGGIGFVIGIFLFGTFVVKVISGL